MQLYCMPPRPSRMPPSPARRPWPHNRISPDSGVRGQSRPQAPLPKRRRNSRRRERPVARGVCLEPYWRKRCPRQPRPTPSPKPSPPFQPRLATRREARRSGCLRHGRDRRQAGRFGRRGERCRRHYGRQCHRRQSPCRRGDRSPRQDRQARRLATLSGGLFSVPGEVDLTSGGNRPSRLLPRAPMPGAETR